MGLDKLESLYAEGSNREKILIDVKSIFNKKKVEEAGYRYWRL